MKSGFYIKVIALIFFLIGFPLKTFSSGDNAWDSDRILSVRITENSSTKKLRTGVFIGNIQNLHYGLTIFNQCDIINPKNVSKFEVQDHLRDSGVKIANFQAAHILDMNPYNGVTLFVFLKDSHNQHFESPSARNDEIKLRDNLVKIYTTKKGDVDDIERGHLRIIEELSAKLKDFYLYGLKLKLDPKPPSLKEYEALSGSAVVNKNNELIGLISHFPEIHNAPKERDDFYQCGDRGNFIYLVPFIHAMDVVDSFMGKMQSKRHDKQLKILEENMSSISVIDSELKPDIKNLHAAVNFLMEDKLKDLLKEAFPEDNGLKGKKDVENTLNVLTKLESFPKLSEDVFDVLLNNIKADEPVITGRIMEIVSRKRNFSNDSQKEKIIEKIRPFLESEEENTLTDGSFDILESFKRVELANLLLVEIIEDKEHIYGPKNGKRAISIFSRRSNPFARKKFNEWKEHPVIISNPEVRDKLPSEGASQLREFGVFK